jgi:hypothetical protein
MDTATSSQTTSPTQPQPPAITVLAGEDIMRRGIKRTLPCKLTDAELLQIALQRVDKEALRDQIEEDFDRIKSKHKAQLEEIDGEIGTMRKELHTGEQDRTVLCCEVFRRDAAGSGFVVTLRMDTIPPLQVEMRPATPTEAQRYLPGVEGFAVDRGAPLLDQAAAAQGGNGAGVPEDGVPDGLDEDEMDDDDDPSAAGYDDDGYHAAGELAETPAQRSARESAEARAARRNGKGKRGKGGAK